MVPVLLRLGPVAVPTHEFFIGVGVAAAAAVFVFEARRRGELDDRIVWILIGAMIGGAVFAKVSTAWQYLQVEPDPSPAGIWLHGGRSVLGGLAGAYVGAEFTKRLVGYRRSTGDLFAPAVAIGLAVGRIGCFLTEQVGTATSVPWGLSVDAVVAARIPMCPGCVAGTPMHPSYLYEIAFHGLMFVFLWRRRDRWGVRGQSFKVYLLAYGLFRFGLEFVRGNPPMWLGLSGSQLFLLATVPLLVAYFIRAARGVLPAESPA